jgi:hypothetical protein
MSYVIVGYLITFIALAGYGVLTIRKTRKLGKK